MSICPNFDWKLSKLTGTIYLRVKVNYGIFLIIQTEVFFIRSLSSRQLSDKLRRINLAEVKRRNRMEVLVKSWEFLMEGDNDSSIRGVRQELNQPIVRSVRSVIFIIQRGGSLSLSELFQSFSRSLSLA